MSEKDEIKINVRPPKIMKIPTGEQLQKYFDMLEEISIKLHICSRIIGSTNPEKQEAIEELQQLSDRLDELIKILENELKKE